MAKSLFDVKEVYDLHHKPYDMEALKGFSRLLYFTCYLFVHLREHS